MKSSKPAPKDDVDRKNSDTTPTDNPSPRSSQSSASSARPGLVRSAPGRLSDLSQSLSGSQDGSREDIKDGGRPRDGEVIGKDAKPKAQRVSSTEGERLEQLRDAVNAKLLLQQRARRSYGSSKGEQTLQGRVSPIREEDHAAAMSPTVASAFASPPPAITRTGSTVSTESTESSKTVRASNPATPAAGQQAMRTPSYPFPYVPGTPRTWQSDFHQPFMSLSPTVSGEALPERQTSRGSIGNVTSGGTTPQGTTNAFMPSGAYFQSPEDPRYPTPNLYDVVLQLNSEPGMEQWWTTVTNLMHDNFSAERVTLVMPLDPTDIENVPWGQKATFSMNGPEEFVPPRTLFEQQAQSTTEPYGLSRPSISLREPSTEAYADFGRQKLHPERLRPRIESRHSYAGHGREAKDVPQRPAGPQRMATHAAGMPEVAGVGRASYRRLLSDTVRHGSLSDPEFSSVAGGGVDAGPYAEVFPTLRNLDHEVRPLIEPGGVNRVLERGKAVAITRDYNASNSDDSSASGASEGASADATPSVPRRSSAARLFGNYRSVFASDNAPSLLKDYEEYEQNPTSPWSQSPAPSPAIQADEESNPFFASDEQQIEDSFNDATTPKDYSQFGQVEAIGVEHASTVIHIPLVHPTLSQPMQSLRTYSASEDRPGPPKRSNTIDMTRKAPIAILSILSSAVPYPHNLSQMLKLLGPHLATSFATSQQFSSTHYSAVSIRHRRTASGRQVNNAPMTIVPTSLEDLVTTDLEGMPSSMSGSVTSPSDYSGRSRHSPSGSIVGTPGWDPASHGWISSKSVSGTPGVTGADMVDNYFEAKKRHGQRSGSNASAQVQSTPNRPARKVPSSDSKSASQKTSPEDSKDPSSDHKSKANVSAIRDKTPVRQPAGKDPSPAHSTEAASPQRPQMRQSISNVAAAESDRKHSQLHSYGADFQSSFGPLPSASTVEPSRPSVMGHARKTSWSEEMPPPSERLLRTIIDSVPVQIFTAEPDTGKMTWLNSKFVIYRGQEAREVLNDPWAAIHPDDRTDFMSSWHRSLRTAQQLQQKVRLERFDGSYRWFYVRAAPLKDKRQKIVHWIGTMMDFHEQQIAEMNSARQQETAASEAKYRALANSSPQIVFAVNRAKGVIFCNSQWVHFSGQTETQALGLGFMDHVHPDDLIKCKLPMFEQGSTTAKNVPTSMPPDLSRATSTSNVSSGGSEETEKYASSAETSPVTTQSTQMPQRKLSELAGTGILKVSRDADGRPSYSTEVRLKSKDGDFRWHLVRVLLAEPQAQVGEDDEVWYGTCTDINDHKTLERDLKETMDGKSRFLSNMSHEIRTPLNGITGMVNFLIDSSLTPEQMEHVNIIRASTEGLRGLINDILDLSKAEAGMIQLNMDWLYVRALIEEVNDLTSTMAIDKGLELNYVVDNDVPPQVKGDRFRIRQILLNIIGNAIKFTSKGEVFVHCSIDKAERYELAQNEINIKFEVVDTGRGFTEKEAEVLFKRFSQIDGSSTRQHGGSGLGLVISRQLAQLHGGDMSATGAINKGSTFTLSIKTTLPSKFDLPPEPAPTPGGVQIPILPMPSGSSTPGAGAKLTKTPSIPMPGSDAPKPSPKFGIEQFQSPSPYESPGRDSPSVSSASSDPSLKSATRTGSLRSERSSASSYVPENTSAGMKLALPSHPKLVKSDSVTSQESLQSGMLTPPMFSILVVCPLKHAREATVQHIDQTLPSTIPHQITARESLEECEQMLGGDDPVLFTHIVAVLQDPAEIVALMTRVFSSPAHTSSSIVIITDLAQRRRIMDLAPDNDYDKLASQLRLRFIFKPLKPSRFAAIFDPQREREMSTDRNQDSAQQVALSQKQVFEELSRRLGNRDKRVLLVEDNKTNQLVSDPFYPSTPNCSTANEVSPGRPQVPLQSLHRRRHSRRRRRMHGKSLRAAAGLLRHHPLRPAHAEQRRLPDVQGDPALGTTERDAAFADHCAQCECVGRRISEVR